MIKLADLITEKKGDAYEYGCAMLYFNLPEINKVHDAIYSGDLYEEKGDRTFGIENEPHTTLLFGLHEEVTPVEVKNVLDKFTFSTCKIGNASLFKNPSYDVLKFDVEGINLHACNKMLRELPHTNNFPNYHPHLTIAYLQPGKGARYVKMLKDLEYEAIPQYAVYSEPGGTKVKIKIRVK